MHAKLEKKCDIDAVFSWTFTIKIFYVAFSIRGSVPVHAWTGTVEVVYQFAF